MITRILIIVAAVLAGTAGPAAAVPYAYSINSLENAMYVSSSTSGYDTWAATCDNVVGGNGCADTDANSPNDNTDETLFFWGSNNASTNSQIGVTWSSAAASDTINSVRITTLRDDDGSMPALGPVDGPKPLLGGAIIYGAPTQGAGLFLTYGRIGPFDDTNTSATIPINPLRYRINLPGASGENVTVMGDPFNLFQPAPPTFAFDAAVPHPVDLDRDLAGNAQAALQPNQTASLRFYNDGSENPPITPVAYMSDFLLQFNPPNAGDGAQVGIVIDGLPDSGEVTYERDIGQLTTNVTLRSGTPAISNATYRVFNQGETGSEAGDGTQGSYGVATATGAGLAIVDGGDATDSASLLLGERTGERSFAFTVQGLGLTDTTGKTAVLTQTITGGSDGDQTQTINLNSVGPILGVNAGAQTLPYGGQINLGQVDLGGSGPYTLEQILTIENLFELDFGDLTDLTIANTGIDGPGADAFGILSQGYANGDVAAADVTFGALEIQFAPASIGLFTASLFFDTDMNRPFGATTDNRLRFDLIGRAIDSSAAVPMPGTPALLAFGLAALAGVLRRAASRP